MAKSTCYKLEWSTEGVVSHTTAEVRDAGSDEIVFYRDTDGEWTPNKGEVSPSFTFQVHKISQVATESREQAEELETNATCSSFTSTSSPRLLVRPTRLSITPSGLASRCACVSVG